MSTTNETSGSNTSTLNFNPTAQGIYNQLIQGGGNVISGYQTNPFGNAAYLMGAGQSQKGAQQAGANNMAALNQNQLVSGLTGQAGAGWLGAQKATTGRANQAMSSQANIQNVLAAMQRQMMAAGTGLSFSPQLTGQTGNFSQSSTMSGLGTYLPQILAGATNAGLSAATGGMSNVAKGFDAGPSNFSSTLSPSTFGSIMGNPGMAGMQSGGLGSQLNFGGGMPQIPPSWLTQSMGQ